MLQFAREQCIKAVVMTPTRELCNQAAKNIAVSIASASYHVIYTVSQKKACDYIFCNNLNNECPIIIIFGTLINETMCHRMVVSFPTSSI